MAQVRPVTSEALEAQIRTLLPSQNGFTEDLQASNVITPIIDLTRAAEGSSVPSFLQQAIAFGSQTAFNVINTTTTLVNTPGFYRIFGVGTVFHSSSVPRAVKFQMSDGLSTKIVWEIDTLGGSTNAYVAVPFDFIVFLATGESLSGKSDSTVDVLAGSTRPIADVNGTLTNPSGFTPQ